VPAGYLYHTIRFHTSSPIDWQPWDDVGGRVTNDPGYLHRGIACASIGSDLHLVGIDGNGTIYHTIRFPTGSPNNWQPWGNVSGTVRNNPGGQFSEISCASIGDNLHVLGVHSNGTIYHTIRFPITPTTWDWQPWGNVSARVAAISSPGLGMGIAPGSFKSVACASIGNDLHVVGLAANGNIWHTIRFPPGFPNPFDWQPWGDVTATVAAISSPRLGMGIAPGSRFSEISCASIGGNLHVVGLHSNGSIYHTIRFPTDWQPWGNVSATVQNNPGGQFAAEISCASIGGNLHVVGLHSNGSTYHTIRFPTGSPIDWQPWGNVTARVAAISSPSLPLGITPGFISAQSANMGNDLHLIAKRPVIL
jgi:hypothetical protein